MRARAFTYHFDAQALADAVEHCAIPALLIQPTWQWVMERYLRRDVGLDVVMIQPCWPELYPYLRFYQDRLVHLPPTDLGIDPGWLRQNHPTQSCRVFTFPEHRSLLLRFKENP